MAERDARPFRILFAPAAGAEIGGGHVMRCLSLAAALAERDCDCAFVAPDWAGPVIEHFGARPFRILPLSDAQALAAVVESEAPDALVIDNYAMAADQEAALRRSTRVLMVVDDLADRPHLADLLVDPGYGRTAADYAALLPGNAEILTGPAYALLRPGFAEGLAKAGHPVRRVFVSFGLSDVGGIAGAAVTRLAPLAPGVRFDVALSETAESLPMLAAFAAQHPGVVLHPDATDVVALMTAADLAVGAGGGGTWERACLGLPSLAVIVADNQRPLIARLAEEGALLAVDGQAQGWEAALVAAFDRMLRDDGLRRRLAATAFALCDGRGAERAADALVRRLSRS